MEKLQFSSQNFIPLVRLIHNIHIIRTSVEYKSKKKNIEIFEFMLTFILLTHDLRKTFFFFDTPSNCIFCIFNSKDFCKIPLAYSTNVIKYVIYFSERT